MAGPSGGGVAANTLNRISAWSKLSFVFDDTCQPGRYGQGRAVPPQEEMPRAETDQQEPREEREGKAGPKDERSSRKCPLQTRLPQKSLTDLFQALFFHRDSPFSQKTFQFLSISSAELISYTPSRFSAR